MDNFFIVANLKSNQTMLEAKEWLLNFKKIEDLKENFSNKEIILCPSFTLLSIFSSFISENNLNVKLGAQNVSPFNEGPYTGEVNAKQVKDFADYVLIGHSERRSLLKETDDMVSEKVERALANGLIPIFFVQNPDITIPSGVKIVVYEPPGSISNASGGVADDINDVLKAAEKIKSAGQYKVLYGGSVNSGNIKQFSSKSNINGVLIGGASLEAEEFIEIIKNA